MGTSDVPNNLHMALAHSVLTRVVVESPYAGNVERNMAYLRACFADCFARNEAPIASHKLYTDIPECQDDIPDRRRLGIVAGFSWGQLADKVVVYTDFGISPGMQDAIRFYQSVGVAVAYRQLPTHILRSFGWNERKE